MIHWPALIISVLLLCRLNDAVMLLAMEIARHFKWHAKLYVIAAIGGFSGYAYHTAVNPAWSLLARPVAIYSAALLNLAGTYAWIETVGKPSITILHLDRAVFAIYPACSGLEGVSLMLFFLSAALLLDWPRFERASIFWPYFSGIVFMLAINVLRIVAILSMADAPRAVELFHSYAGVVLDVMAIAGFIEVVRRRMLNKAIEEGV